MARRTLQSNIDDAIRTVTDDVSRDRVTNWCKHIRVKQLNTSPLGEAIGLPIGLKTVECPYFSGFSGMTIRGSAELFIRSNCLGCKYHEEVHPNNIGREVLGTPEEQPKDPEESTNVATRPLPNFADASLDDANDPCDMVVSERLAQLARPELEIEAVKALVAMSQAKPSAFGRRAANAISGAFADPNIGAGSLLIVRNLARERQELYTEAIPLARSCLEDGRHVNEAALLIADAAQAGFLTVESALVGSLIQYIPTEHAFWDRSGRGPVREGVIESFRRIASLAWPIASAEIQRRLNLQEPYERAQAASAAIQMVNLNAASAAADLTNSLVMGLILADDDDAYADASIRDAIALLLKHSGEIVGPKIIHLAKLFRTDEAREAAWRCFASDTALSGDVQAWLPALVRLLAASEPVSQDAESLSETIAQIAYGSPSHLIAHLDVLIGVLAMVSQARDEIGQTPITVETSVEDRILGQERLARADLVLKHLRDIIGRLLVCDFDSCFSTLSSVIDNAPSPTSAFKVAVLRSVSQAAERLPSHTSDLVHFFYQKLFDPHSSGIRSYAAEAYRDLAKAKGRDVLPDDVLVALSALLADTHLGPIQGSSRALARVNIHDEDLAALTIRRLLAVFNAYVSDPVTRMGLLEDLADAVVNITRQHKRWLPVAAHVLATGCAPEYYYLAHRFIRDFGWFARRNVGFQGVYVEHLIAYYEKFELAMSTSSGYGSGWGNDDSSFETLFYIEPKIIEKYLEGLTTLGNNEKHPLNGVLLAAAISWAGQPATAASMLKHFTLQAAEPRQQYQTKRFAAGATCPPQARPVRLWRMPPTVPIFPCSRGFPASIRFGRRAVER
jgi:hypothetical protein